nr:unnamed protein product [Callosobruchus analis]
MILGSDRTDWDLSRTSGDSVQYAVVISEGSRWEDRSIRTYRQRQMYRSGWIVNSECVEKKRIGKEEKQKTTISKCVWIYSVSNIKGASITNC